MSELPWELRSPATRVRRGAYQVQRRRLRRDLVGRRQRPLSSSAAILIVYSTLAMVGVPTWRIASPRVEQWIRVTAPGFAPIVAGPFMPKEGVYAPVDLVLEPGFTGTIRVVDEAGKPVTPSEALICCWSMRENILTPAASLKIGDKIGMKLVPWSAVADAVQNFNRSELPDDALLLEEHVWGEPVK